MLAQRPPDAAPAVQGTAEELPFGDKSFDAAMAVLSLHHWTDRARGLAEMRRVARGPVVVFLRDPAAAEPWWLYRYFPATARLVANRETPLDEVAKTLGALDVVPVPIPADCNDGFEAAYWRPLCQHRVRRSWSLYYELRARSEYTMLEFEKEAPPAVEWSEP